MVGHFPEDFQIPTNRISWNFAVVIIQIKSNEIKLPYIGGETGETPLNKHNRIESVSLRPAVMRSYIRLGRLRDKPPFSLLTSWERLGSGSGQTESDTDGLISTLRGRCEATEFAVSPLHQWSCPILTYGIFDYGTQRGTQLAMCIIRPLLGLTDYQRTTS